MFRVFLPSYVTMLEALEIIIDVHPCMSSLVKFTQLIWTFQGMIRVTT